MDVHIRTFLIADVRGYTLFTQERGDEAATKLAARFASVARQVVEEHGGSVIELRGDEALAAFSSARQAILAATHAQDRFLEETVADPSFPLPVGIGLDAGEAVPLEAGYRGGALNLAARLCGRAGPGEILASQGGVHLARKVEGVRYVDRGDLRLKGLAEPVRVFRAISEEADPAARFRELAPRRPRGPVPLRLVRRHPAMAIFVVLALIAAVAVPTTNALRGGSGEATTGPTANTMIPLNSLVQIEAEDSAILSVTPTSAGSGGDLPVVAVGEGAVWMLVSGALGRVDAADPADLDSVTIGTINTTTSFALAERLVWAATDTGIARISATDLRPLGVIELADGSIVSTYVTAGGGQVWAVVGNGQLTQIDPRTAEVIKSIDVGQSASGVTAGFGAVWVADDLTGTITPVNMETLRPGTPIAIPGDIDDLEAGAGSVWSLDTDAGVVTPIDPDTDALGSPVRVGVRPTDLASGLGALWVTNNGDGTISRIDPVTGGVTSMDVGAPVAGIAVDERGLELWVVVAVTSQ